jgi:hypothetical protein
MNTKTDVIWGRDVDETEKPNFHEILWTEFLLNPK